MCQSENNLAKKLSWQHDLSNLLVLKRIIRVVDLFVEAVFRNNGNTLVEKRLIRVKIS